MYIGVRFPSRCLIFKDGCAWFTYLFATDINECESDVLNDCQQRCTNTPEGSYTCSCDPGYVLISPDNKNCAGELWTHL